MEKFKRNVLYGAAGFLGGLTGLIPLSRCSGSACASCLGCAGFGVVVVAMALLRPTSTGADQCEKSPKAEGL
ncbi:MAG: hypothetical protein HQL06_00295 [Nitrospirae bacterium]|nr:hypothetical protein [Nitrospirota bacterium]